MKIYAMNEEHDLASCRMDDAIARMAQVSDNFRSAFIDSDGQLVWNAVAVVNGAVVTGSELAAVHLQDEDEVHLILQLAGGRHVHDIG